MKIKRARKIITLMLVLLLAAQLTSIASAVSTETWTGSDGYTYSATVSRGNSSTKERVPVTATKIHHTNGKVEKIYPGTWSVTATGNMTFPSAYASKLQSAANSEGLKNSYTDDVTLVNALSIPASSASGYYCLGTRFDGNTGTYRVEKMGATSTTIVKSGSFSFAPYACTGDTFLYGLSLDG